MERTHVTVDNRANNLGAPQTSWTRRDTLKISWALQCVAVIHDNIRYLHNIPEITFGTPGRAQQENTTCYLTRKHSRSNNLIAIKLLDRHSYFLDITYIENSRYPEIDQNEI
jgi:hypothetical protein